jgi:phage baseplate assembly protein V
MSVENAYMKQYNPPFRQGVVYALESTPPYRVRVQFPDRDGVISYWLPISVPKIAEDKFFWQPDIGELVLVLMDEHDENGCVVGSMPNAVDGAPPGLGPDIFYIGFKDGTTLQYNRATHQLQVELGTGGSLSLAGSTGSSITMDPTGDIAFNSAAAIKFHLGGAGADDGIALVSKLIAAFNTHTHGTPPTTGTPTTPWTPDTVSSGTIQVTD